MNERDILLDKLEFLRLEFVKNSDARQKFSIKK